MLLYLNSPIQLDVDRRRDDDASSTTRRFKNEGSIVKTCRNINEPKSKRSDVLNFNKVLYKAKMEHFKTFHMSNTFCANVYFWR